MDRSPSSNGHLRPSMSSRMSSSTSITEPSVVLEKRSRDWRTKPHKADMPRADKLVRFGQQNYLSGCLYWKWEKLASMHARHKASQHSRCIDKYLQGESERLQITVLLLGATLWSHCAWFHGVAKHERGSLGSEELERCKRRIFASVTNSTRSILNIMVDQGVPLPNDEARAHASAVPEISGALEREDLPEEVGKAIIALWNEPTIRSFHEADRHISPDRDHEA